MFGDLFLQGTTLKIEETKVIAGLNILLNVPILISKAKKLIHKDVSVNL